MTPEQLYRSVMHPYDLNDTSGKFTVRIYDGMDFCWCDVGEATNVDWEIALKVWMERTKNGTDRTNFSHIDYYRIFPADTRMIYSSEFVDSQD